MTYEHPLTLVEYIRDMQSLSGMKLDDCYHTQDSMLRFVLVDNSRRIILILDGNWQLWDGQKEICNSAQDPSETDHEYYEKLRSSALNIKNHGNGVSEINFDRSGENAKVIFDNGWRLEVAKNKFGLLSYQDDLSEEYLMYSIDEKTDTPRYYKSKL